MKKILLILSLALLINCSLDTFKSENLASWSVNIDFPLFQSTYTIDELLGDIEELDVEKFDDNDSIYVFNANTYFDVQADFIPTKDGDDILPEVITVEPYEIGMPTLPGELDGINIVEIDLWIEIDLNQFNTALADSVILNYLTLTASNESGVVNSTTTTNKNILTTGIIEIDDPEALINIRPNLVIAEGQITIYPTAAAGDATFQETVILNTRLHAPLILEITEEATFSGNTNKVDGTVDDELFKELYLFLDVDNQMEVGGNLQLLVAQDTFRFHESSQYAPDTLFTLDLLPKNHSIDTIAITNDKLALLADSTYIKTALNLLSYTNDQGDVIPTHLFTEDYISVLMYSSAELLIDPQNIGEED